MILHRFQSGRTRIDYDEPVAEHTPHLGYTRGPGHGCYKPNNDLRPFVAEAGGHYPQHRVGDLLDTMCWCGEIGVQVTPRDVLNGRTLSCGQRDCTPEFNERAERRRARDRRRGARYKSARREIAWQQHYDMVKAEQLLAGSSHTPDMLSSPNRTDPTERPPCPCSSPT